MNWIDINEKHLEFGEEVIGYNPAWVDEDFNPNGIRIGFLSDCGDDGVKGQDAYNISGEFIGQQHFCQAKWNNEHDCYITLYGDKEDVSPNMPTHYIIIPKHP